LVLEPLGMAGSWFPTQAPVSPDAAHGYRLEREGSFVPEPLPVFALQSAGGLWSTGPDLVRFGSGWRTLLPAELAEQALRPHAVQFDSVADAIYWHVYHEHAATFLALRQAALVDENFART